MLNFIGSLFSFFASLFNIEFDTGLTIGSVLLASILLGWVSYFLGIMIKAGDTIRGMDSVTDSRRRYSSSGRFDTTNYKVNQMVDEAFPW